VEKISLLNYKDAANNNSRNQNKIGGCLTCWPRSPSQLPAYLHYNIILYYLFCKSLDCY